MSPFDATVLAIIFFATLISVWLGLVRVVLALVGWSGASAATAYGLPYVRPFAREWVTPGIFADIAAGVTLFIFSLIVITMISHSIGRRIRSSRLSTLDRTLGLVFGFGLGTLIVSVGYLVMVWIIDLPEKAADQPDWIRTARTRPAVEWVANRILAVAPSGLLAPPAKGDMLQKEALEIERSLRNFVMPETRGSQLQGKPGYNVKERREMDRLIKSHQ
jgi:membrane protein required for colicin V production